MRERSHNQQAKKNKIILPLNRNQVRRIKGITFFGHNSKPNPLGRFSFLFPQVHRSNKKSGKILREKKMRQEKLQGRNPSCYRFNICVTERGENKNHLSSLTKKENVLCKNHHLLYLENRTTTTTTSKSASVIQGLSSSGMDFGTRITVNFIFLRFFFIRDNDIEREHVFR